MFLKKVKKSIVALRDDIVRLRIGSSILSLFSHTVEYKNKIERTIPHWNVREKAHPAIIRFGLVLLLLLIALFFKFEINNLTIYHLPFMLFYSVIVVSAWYGGLRPGIFAVILSALLANYFFLPPTEVYGSFSISLSLILFMLEGVLIVGVSHSMHQALQRLDDRKRQYQYFASIAQHISDAVISTDLSFVIQSWNEGAERLYGWKRSEVMGRSLIDVLPLLTPNLAMKDITHFLMTEESWKGEVTHRRKTGGRVHILTSMSVIKGDHNEFLGIVAVNRDITDRKKLEQGKDDFIALASHELKTPLTSIKLYADVLKQRFEKNDDTKSMVYLSKINVQMNKLLELVNHLLDVSKVQSGKLQYNMEEVRIDTFVRQIVKVVQEVIPTHKITIEESVDVVVKIDKDLMRQVFVNILTNAAKYSGKSDQIHVLIRKERGHVVVGIRDFGIGIPAEKLEKIFERFYQVTDSKGYTYSGMGLGLYIAYEIIEKHKGKLWVESEEGKGSTFFFTLPTGK